MFKYPEEGPLVALTPEELNLLRDPRVSLPQFGKVLDLVSRQIVPYDPTALTFQGQAWVLNFLADPPRDADGFTYWLNLLAPRRFGKSVLGELAFYPKVATIPGYKHLCIADNGDRAKMLHQVLHDVDSRWPAELKGRRGLAAAGTKEVNQITFDRLQGGRADVIASTFAAGIGASLDSLHVSECAFMRDYSALMSVVHPALFAVKDAVVFNECTPAPTGLAASAEAWRDQFEAGLAAQEGNPEEEVLSRYRSVFFSVMDCKTCVRPWPKKARLEDWEQSYLERYHTRGLHEGHIAFFRYVLATDREISRDPELLFTYYPLDSVTCWRTSTGGTFPDRYMNILRNQLLTPWQPEANTQVYEAHSADCPVLITVDAVGEAARDHGVVTALSAWEEEIAVLATHAAHTRPEDLADIACKFSDAYGKAPIVVESNGVGQGFIAYVVARGYGGRLIRQDPGEYPPKHGIALNSTIRQQSIALTQDEILAGRLLIRDEELYRQLSKYRDNKSLEQGVRAEQVAKARGVRSTWRTDRHHWDRVSALLLGVYTIRKLMPVRYRTRALPAQPSWLEDLLKTARQPAPRAGRIAPPWRK